MRRSDLQREENYYEFLRLSQIDYYIDVTYDEQSGGVSAVHKQHKFDKQKGPFGICRGDYERIVVDVLRNSGYRIILESEKSIHETKQCDGLLNDIPMEIKSIEGLGAWTICTKLLNAEKQHAECTVLYFPKKSLYSEPRVLDGIGKYMAHPELSIERRLHRIIVLCEQKIVAEWNKKTTPIEGWSI